MRIRLDENGAVQKARSDLARRAGVSESEVETESVTKTDFPDMALGAAVGGEVSAQMISTGWRIILKAGGRRYEYRADKSHLRLFGFGGSNFVIE